LEQPCYKQRLNECFCSTNSFQTLFLLIVFKGWLHFTPTLQIFFTPLDYTCFQIDLIFQVRLIFTWRTFV